MMEEQQKNRTLGAHVDAFLKSVEENQRQYDRVSVKDGCIVIKANESITEGGEYWFPLSEVETAAGVCRWIQQLMEKTWCNQCILEKILSLIERHNTPKPAQKFQDNGL